MKVAHHSPSFLRKGQGVVVISLTFLFAGCVESLVAPNVDSSPPAVFEELWQEFSARYAVFNERHVDWDALHDRYKSLVTPETPDSMLLRAFDSLLSPLRDAHVGVTGEHEYLRYIHLDSTRQINVDQISSFYLGETAEESANGAIRYGRIEDSIGYMNVRSFEESSMANWANDIDAALNAIWDTKALIVDLRGNTGGYGHAAQVLGARFIPGGQIIGYNQERYDADRTHLSVPTPQYSIDPRGKLWTKPIVLLTDRGTMSAAEWVTMGARILPNITIIGDTTQGAFSSRLDRKLSNGWRYSLSMVRGTDVNLICHEGIGLIPDIEIYVRENQRTVSLDTVLDRAIQYLK